jgi:ABC-type bacteriocin/lantibiotic exporter with double-glycine peptidase domain
MSQHWSLLSIFITIFLLQISSIYSTPLNSDLPSRIIDENTDNQHAVFYLIKNILTETNSDEQIMLLNQLREYLNRMCIVGYFGSTHAHACQRVVDIVHQYDENNLKALHDDTNNEQHGIQKRFFCNGFIGCKAGR